MKAAGGSPRLSPLLPPMGRPRPWPVSRPRLPALLGREGFQLEGHLVDLAGELERNIVAILHHRDACARVLADVEGLVLRERDRDGVFHGIPGHFLAIHEEEARPPFAQTRT